MFQRKNIYQWLFSISFFIGFYGTANAKSVYVINDTEVSTLRAYKIADTNLIYQKDYHCESFPLRNKGAVGLTLDESEYGDFIFATVEDTDLIEIIDAKSMQFAGLANICGASNLAGIGSCPILS